jgi:hypothetical protein
MQERGTYLIDLRSYDSVGYYTRVESFAVNPDNPDNINYNTREVAVYDSVYTYTHTTPLFKYDYVNIPLTLGYRFLETEKITMSLNTGLILHLLAGKEVPENEMVYPESTVIRTSDITPERVDWNLRWQIGIRLNYKLTPSLGLAAEPVFTKYLNSVYDTGKGYKNVKPYTMGIRVGVYYGF